jgi:hypothetical protein
MTQVLLLFPSEVKGCPFAKSIDSQVPVNGVSSEVHADGRELYRYQTSQGLEPSGGIGSNKRRPS